MDSRELRAKAIKELIATEKTYSHQLQVLQKVSVYYLRILL